MEPGSETKFDAAANEYVAVIELTTGGHYFKIASKDLAAVDPGLVDVGYVEIGIPEQVQQVAFNDLSIDPDGVVTREFEFYEDGCRE